MGGSNRWQSLRVSIWGLLRRTPPLVLAMAVLAAGLVASSALLVKGLRRGSDGLTVTGASTERIRSDTADWSVEVSSSGPTQALAYQALPPAVAATTDFLSRQGLARSEWQLGTVGSERQDARDPQTGELRSTTWTSRQKIRIVSQDVEKVQTLSRAIGTLIGQGIPLTIEAPAFTFSGLSAKRVDMLAKATADARTRAKAIAREAGSRIGAIVSADTGSFQITAPNSTELGGSGSYDTSTIEKDITAVMAVTFRVE